MITATELHVQEQAARDAEHEMFESFYRIGTALSEIRDQRLYEAENYRSWNAYCKSGRLEYGKRNADKLIRCAEVRKHLPNIGTLGTRSSQQWTVKHVEQVARMSTPSDMKRIGRKVAKLAANGDMPTSANVKHLVDIDLGVDEAARERKRQQRARTDEEYRKISEGTTPSETLRDMAAQVKVWSNSLGEVPAEFWSEADAAWLISELRTLASTCERKAK